MSLPPFTISEKEMLLLYEYERKMSNIAESSNYDVEVDHSKADKLLCELLEKLGYKNIVDIFISLEKWYS